MQDATEKSRLLTVKSTRCMNDTAQTVFSVVTLTSVLLNRNSETGAF